jgi:hypothetical protein
MKRVAGIEAMAAGVGNVSERHAVHWRATRWGGAACLLLLPWVAMQFTGEVTWSRSDFAVMGAMLAVACGTYELATRITGSIAYRAAVAVAIVTAFLLVWLSLAVGIIGAEDNPANLIFAGVLAVGIIGALIAWFRPRGMMRVLVAMALTQALVSIVALIAGWGSSLPLTGCFVAAWLVSAWLFRRAALEQGTA